MSNGEGTMDIRQVHERMSVLRRQSVELHEAIVELWSSMDDPNSGMQQWRDIVWGAAQAAQETTRALGGRR